MLMVVYNMALLFFPFSWQVDLAVHELLENIFENYSQLGLVM